MKRTISLMLIIILCFGLCSCKNAEKEEIKKILTEQPSWTYTVDDSSEYIYALSEEGYRFSVSGSAGYFYYSSVAGKEVTNIKKNGTYTIEDDRIIISYDNGVDDILKYEYNNGKLKLYKEHPVWGTIIYS